MTQGELVTVELQTDELQVVVLPELGGRISSLVDVASGREWLWANTAIGTYAVEPGAAYDPNWQGGWEELFPNDAATTMDGRDLPDHGELWSVPWEIVASDAMRVTLRATGFSTGTVVTKTFTVDRATLTIGYSVQHNGDTPLPYLFKLHPAIAVHGDCHIELPGGTIEPVDPRFGSMLPDGQRSPWPGPTGHDISRCHDASSGLHEFVYVHDVPTGSVGVRDERTGRRLTIEYPLEVFGWCWFFLTYGGWNDLHVAVLEPCTTYPKDLDAARRAGTTPTLAPGDHLTFEVRCTVAGV